jgi:uncharacterized protein
VVSKNDILAFLELKKPEFKRDFKVTRLGLIGSYSTGKQTKESDIDLIVEFERGTENLTEIKEKIKKSVKARFHLNVDICRQKYLKPYVRTRILKDAIFI